MKLPYSSIIDRIVALSKDYGADRLILFGSYTENAYSAGDIYHYLKHFGCKIPHSERPALGQLQFKQPRITRICTNAQTIIRVIRAIRGCTIKSSE